MEILYFLGKTSLILAIFFCGYRALMARDTFYVFNRYYLLAGLVASLLVPLLVFTQTVYVEPVSAPVIEMEQDNIADPVENIVPVSEVSMPASKDSFHFWELIFYAYLIGVLFFVGRFAFSLFGIVRFSRKHLSFKENGLRYIEISGLPAPFSFFNTIVYDPEKPTKEELNLILAHERQHARQLHSIDLLLGRLFCALFWFNPLAWFYARAIEQNLEFLADTKVADLGFPKTDYQLTLLHISAGKTPALTQSFYQSFIKKQIIMLNKNSSNPYRKLKILLMLPFLALFIYGFNIKEAIKYREATKPINTALTSDMMQKNVDSSYRYVIKKNTTKEEIDSIKAVLAEKYGAVLKVLDIDRNINGVIIEINIDVDDIGGKVTYHPKNFFGIADILISRDGDRSFGVGPLNENKTTTRMHN